MGVLVGVGGRSVDVGKGVSVGGADVAVGRTGISVDGADVAVGGTGVSVCCALPQAASRIRMTIAIAVVMIDVLRVDIIPLLLQQVGLAIRPTFSFLIMTSGLLYTLVPGNWFISLLSGGLL